MAKTESIQCPSMRIQEIFLIETNFYSVKTPKSQIVSFLSWQTQLFLVASLKQDHLVQMNTTIKFCFSTKFKNFSERNRNQIWLNLLKKRKVWSQCSQARRGLLKVSRKEWCEIIQIAFWVHTDLSGLIRFLMLSATSSSKKRQVP